MKWNEITGVRKGVLILCVLCAIAGFTLTILDIMNVLESVDIIEDVIDCVFWLSAGCAFWKKKSLFPIICFAMAGLKFICVFL